MLNSLCRRGGGDVLLRILSHFIAAKCSDLYRRHPSSYHRQLVDMPNTHTHTRTLSKILNSHPILHNTCGQKEKVCAGCILWRIIRAGLRVSVFPRRGTASAARRTAPQCARGPSQTPADRRPDLPLCAAPPHHVGWIPLPHCWGCSGHCPPPPPVMCVREREREMYIISHISIGVCERDWEQRVGQYVYKIVD